MAYNKNYKTSHSYLQTLGYKNKNEGKNVGSELCNRLNDDKKIKKETIHNLCMRAIGAIPIGFLGQSILCVLHFISVALFSWNHAVSPNVHIFLVGVRQLFFYVSQLI